MDQWTSPAAVAWPREGVRPVVGSRPPSRGRFDVIVIGAGQSGLSVGYHLARRGLSFVILERDRRIGDVWRRRWDSLRLFTSARYDGLDGLPFPAPADSFPTKDEMGNYLEAYARRFDLPVRTGVTVQRLFRVGERYGVSTSTGEYQADQVVVAMATYQEPRLPSFAAGLDAGIVQIDAREYKNPDQLRPGDVLIVGAGNSGAEIALDLASRLSQASPPRRLWLSGRDTGHLPFHIDGPFGRRFFVPLVLRFLFHHVLTVRTPMGRKLRPRMMHQGAPLIRTKPKDLAEAGVERVPRLGGTRDGKPLLVDGRVLDVANVIWCNGYTAGLSWIDLPIFDEEGEPLHEAGVVPEAPGLYFVGLHFLYSMSSTMIHGVGRDAARIVEALASRARALAPTADRREEAGRRAS